MYAVLIFRVDPYALEFMIHGYTQAEQHHVPTYIVGFVIGTAALCVAVMSSLCGYLVRHLGCDLSSLGCSLCCHSFFSL